MTRPAPGLLLATRNSGKAAEFRAAFEALGVSVATLDEAGVVESSAESDLERHATFEENAAAKAAYFARLTGRAVLADDSGLVVDALRGAPGVHSRRWSGVLGSPAAVSAANNAKLLWVLTGVEGRSARFECVLVVAHGAGVAAAHGRVEGRIAHAPRGVHGFGYDPLFEAADLGWRTFGEATAAEKAGVSHRGRALAALLAGPWWTGGGGR